MHCVRTVGRRRTLLLAGFVVVGVGSGLLSSPLSSTSEAGTSRAAMRTIACMRQLSSPLAPKPSFLGAVTASAPDDIWAVGSEGPYPGRPLIERYDGHDWIQERGIPMTRGSLTDVSVTSRRDVWAIGHTMGRADRPVVIHWNGMRWRRIDLLPTVYYVAALSTTRAGTWLLAYDANAHPTLSKWTYGAWKTASAGLPRRYIGDDIAMISPDEGWTVGYLPGHSGAADDYDGYIGRWNGRRWRSVRVPSALIGGIIGRDYGEEVASLAVAGPRNLSVTGFAASTGFTGVFVLDWNGASWRLQRDPGSGRPVVGGYGSSEEAIAAGPSGTRWIVGREDTVAYRARGRWSPIPAGSRGVDLHAVTSTAQGVAWAVGERDVSNSPDRTAVVERFRCND
jgi:hypothetical protein